jgi:quinol monooxygenase YgiN
MVTKALLVLLEAKPGKGDAVEDFLVWAGLLVEKEPDTKPWLAVRFNSSTFGIIDAFPDDEARQTHLAGPVGQELKEKAELFASPPRIVKVDVLADKL